MGDTNISWTDKVWNCIRGCTRVSEGCRHCYAERHAGRFCGKGQPYEGLIKISTKETVRRRDFVDGSVELRKHETRDARWNGEVLFAAEHLSDPLRWTKHRRIFVNSMSDLFHEKLSNEQIAAIFGVMAAGQQHTFQVLTKRPKRMREWFLWLEKAARECNGSAGMTPAARCFVEARKLEPQPSHEKQPAQPRPKRKRGTKLTSRGHVIDAAMSAAWPLPNIWLGVSVENRAALHRLNDLCSCPAALRFVSAEPLLEDLGKVDLNGIGWLITGCESGPGSRPCDDDWLRSLRDQCAAGRVPFFLKQGRETPYDGDREDPREVGYASGPVMTPAPLPIAVGHGSKRKRGGIIELPYLDGVQHGAFPGVTRESGPLRPLPTRHHSRAA